VHEDADKPGDGVGCQQCVESLIPPPDPLESGSHIKVSFPQRMLAVELRM